MRKETRIVHDYYYHDKHIFRLGYANSIKAHPPLDMHGHGSMMEFVYVEKNAYPFVYLRKSDEEQILVILNPSDKEVSFTCDYEPKEAVYSFGEKVRTEGNKIVVPAQSAGFYSV